MRFYHPTWWIPYSAMHWFPTATSCGFHTLAVRVIPYRFRGFNFHSTTRTSNESAYSICNSKYIAAFEKGYIAVSRQASWGIYSSPDEVGFHPSLARISSTKGGFIPSKMDLSPRGWIYPIEDGFHCACYALGFIAINLAFFISYFISPVDGL